MTAKAVVNMAAEKRRLANNLRLACAGSNSAAAVNAASRDLAPDLERNRITTGTCCERVLLATGCTGAVGVGGGGGTVAGSALGAASCCTLSCEFSAIDAGGVLQPLLAVVAVHAPAQLHEICYS